MSSTPLRPSSEHEGPPHKTRTKRWRIGAVVVVLIAVVVAAVVLGVIFGVVRRDKKQSSSSSSSPSSPSSSPGSDAIATTGGDGSTITTANGTQFIYNNPFGGIWVSDPANPFNNDARPNSWTPALNTSWTWGVDRVYGVNLGGWLVMEPFITPSLYDKYAPDAIDEWTLSVAMANDPASGGLGQLETHYDTFVTEQDIAQMAGAGLNWIRVPLPFWAIETWEGEPFLAKTSWTYFLRMLEWARKYGMRVCLDLHTIPGSQNGYNHSGRLSPVNFLSGNMGLANAQRTLYYIRVLTEFISQPAYRDLIPIFGIVNEALLGVIGRDQLTSFYLQAHTMIREITGFGEGNGPYIAIHDGFQSLSSWADFLQGSDRIMLDTHPYFSFGGVDTAPMAVLNGAGKLGGKWPLQACSAWGPSMNTSQTAFGVTFAGEWAASPNNCGYFLLGAGTTSSDPQCPEYDDYQNYNDTMKGALLNYVQATMDAQQDWFFWTWKIGPNMAGVIGSPLWSYQLGLQEGWIPADPRTAVGNCEANGLTPVPFNGTYAPWATGEATSTIAASSTSSFPWPPPTISNADVPVSLMPTYTSTADIITMPAATFTSAPSSVTASVDGWFDPQDTTPGVTAVAGCTYPDEYNGLFTGTITVPTAPCTGPTSL
ncbi:glycoside hydrolase family 5 protein [Roridomyces roridus]|uniref:glucan 1,3-beta-glucosidase n=1 Tax=Roridomyces roridus TaxID=1738132 RepID=A0AAD7FRH9_9AGAR|nr:glycoside hydrolase family 5 protein [Roridomyces roridus]